ncbi:hypothetical protein MPTK1_1g25900 [Marchantia polymorpha subsp. ruderalis]|uniref:Uncharacterized protein n=2 Tax=Marchantia polymorpha TaxID=3197 RepID=A0AAF6AUB6_MARPO|nr:hypothetical protein MARPO_0002s0286 [Marchantia polymorpha]BBN00037.1 hypothetical protein Mp_1g25900 [Marchantia polymorpha subsp. ruderalis]|eukprot:PTQ49846.1 hypothetical protein MARPO_0002s0286 [Marchantia polymorpha]
MCLPAHDSMLLAPGTVSGATTKKLCLEGCLCWPSSQEEPAFLLHPSLTFTSRAPVDISSLSRLDFIFCTWPSCSLLAWNCPFFFLVEVLFHWELKLANMAIQRWVHH